MLRPFGPVVIASLVIGAINGHPVPAAEEEIAAEITHADHVSRDPIIVHASAGAQEILSAAMSV